MQPKTKKILIISASLISLSVVGYFIYKHFNKKVEEKQKEIDKSKSDAQALMEQTKTEAQALIDKEKANAKAAIKAAQGASELEQANTYFINYYKMPKEKITFLSYDPAYVISKWKSHSQGLPTFKALGETFDTYTGKLYKPILSGKSVLGNNAYPKVDKVNARSTPEVSGGMKGVNLIGTFSAKKDKSIGIVREIQRTNDKHGSYNWYRIEPKAPLVNSAGKDVAEIYSIIWVREDNVIVK